MQRYILVMLTLPEIPSPDQLEAACDASLGRVPLTALHLDLYKPRRQVKASNLEDLFHRCQHIEPIPDHPMKGLRSLSVGDFAVDAEGCVHHCQSIGWGEAVPEIANPIRALAIPYWIEHIHD